MTKSPVRERTLTQAVYAALDRARTGPKNDDPRRVGTSAERLEYLTDTVVSALTPFVIAGTLREEPRDLLGVLRDTKPLSPIPAGPPRTEKLRVPAEVVAEVRRLGVTFGKSKLFDTNGPWAATTKDVGGAWTIVGVSLDAPMGWKGHVSEWHFDCRRTEPETGQTYLASRPMMPMPGVEFTYRIEP